jgi:hypothetical protein
MANGHPLAGPRHKPRSGAVTPDPLNVPGAAQCGRSRGKAYDHALVQAHRGHPEGMAVTPIRKLLIISVLMRCSEFQLPLFPSVTYLISGRLSGVAFIGVIRPRRAHGGRTPHASAA